MSVKNHKHDERTQNPDESVERCLILLVRTGVLNDGRKSFFLAKSHHVCMWYSYSSSSSRSCISFQKFVSSILLVRTGVLNNGRKSFFLAKSHHLCGILIVVAVDRVSSILGSCAGSVCFCTEYSSNPRNERVRSRRSHGSLPPDIMTYKPYRYTLSEISILREGTDDLQDSWIMFGFGSIRSIDCVVSLVCAQNEY